MCRGWLEQQQQAPDRVATPSWQGQREVAEGHNNDSLHSFDLSGACTRQAGVWQTHENAAPCAHTPHTEYPHSTIWHTPSKINCISDAATPPHTGGHTDGCGLRPYKHAMRGQHHAAARYTRTASAPAPTPHTTAPHDRTRHTSMTCPDHLHSRSLTHKHAHGQKR
jgi:hypothetical protein